MTGDTAEGRQHPVPRLFGRELSAALVGTTAMALPVFLVATMAVQLRDSLHFGPTGLGLSIGGYYLGAAVCSMPGSRVAEAIGGARMMRLLLVTGAAVELAIATGAASWGTLSVLLIVAGGLSGAMGPGTNLFLARRSARERQGFVFGLKQAAVPLSSLLGGLAVPGIALSIGWRWAFAAAGVLTVGAILLVPASRTGLAERRRQRREQPPPEVRTKPLVVLGVAFGMGVLAAAGCVAFLVSAAVDLGFGKGTAGVLAAVAAAAAVASRAGSGYRADRRGGRHLPVVATMLVVGAGGYVALAGATALGSRALFAAAAVIALGSGWGWNGLLNFAVVRTHPQAPAIATGITQVGARLGGVVGPVLVGFVIAHSSYAVGWLVPAAAAVCGAGAVLVARRMLVAAGAAPALASSAAPEGRAAPGGKRDASAP